jgi:CheY-like chemotaxis protein
VSCDAALLDTNLSGERVDELAALLTRRNIPFAFITGYGREALPEGFHEGLLLTKPFSQDQLRAMLETLLYQRQKLAQIPSRRA